MFGSALIATTVVLKQQTWQDTLKASMLKLSILTVSIVAKVLKEAILTTAMCTWIIEIWNKYWIFCLDFDSINSKMISLGGGRWQCTDCSYISGKSYNMKKHIESKHVIPKEYTCQFCEKIILGRSAYDNHIHKCRKYSNVDQ